MVVSAGKKADLQKVGMLSSLKEISTYFIIYLTVKWFMNDFEWFTVSLKTPGPQVSVWNKSPLPGG